MSTESAPRDATGFNRGAAVTRSLLGWGVVVGPFYLVIGLVLAFVVPGFDLSRHALSLLMLAPLGWIQTTNLILSGLMVAAAAIGFLRALPTPLGRWAGSFLGIYGLCLLGSAIFPPDPMAGFPAGSQATNTGSVSGILHLAFGAFGFLSLAIAATMVGRWFRSIGELGSASFSWVAAVVVVLGFSSGAALAMTPIGVALLWVAVVAGWVWLLVASIRTYRIAPHPDCFTA